MDLFEVFYVKRYGYLLRERTCEPLRDDKPGSFSHCHSAKNILVFTCESFSRGYGNRGGGGGGSSFFSSFFFLSFFLTVCFPFINEVSNQQTQQAANLLLPHSSMVTSVHGGIFHSDAGRRGLDRIKAAQRLFRLT